MIALLGWIWWVLLPVRKRLAVANYVACFPERDPGELRRTVGELVLGYLELALGRRAEGRGLDLLRGGGLVLAGHGGAWDLCLISAARELPVTIFVRQPSNPLAAWLIARARRRADIELLPPRGSMEAAYRALERGRVVVFVQDQRHNAGIPVPFFGRAAWTSPAFGAMAWRTRAPIFGVWQGREPGGRHWVAAERLDWAIPADREAAVRALTEQSQRFYEQKIRSRPWSWLWLHDRWKVPSGGATLGT